MAYLTTGMTWIDFGSCFRPELRPYLPCPEILDLEFFFREDDFFALDTLVGCSDVSG